MAASQSLPPTGYGMTWHPIATHEIRVNENMEVVDISPEELTGLNDVFESVEVAGHRHIIPGADNLLCT